MANPDFYDDQDECWNCGGEGYVYNCIQEYACVDPESGCDLCMRRCSICNPKKRSADTEALRAVLGEALQVAERKRG